MGKITFVVVIYLTVTTAHKTRNVKSLSVIYQQSVLSKYVRTYRPLNFLSHIHLLCKTKKCTISCFCLFHKGFAPFPTMLLSIPNVGPMSDNCNCFEVWYNPVYIWIYIWYNQVIYIIINQVFVCRCAPWFTGTTRGTPGLSVAPSLSAFLLSDTSHSSGFFHFKLSPTS